MGPPPSEDAVQLGEAVVDIESHCLVSLTETVQVSLGSNRKITGETSRSSSRGEFLDTSVIGAPENILIPSSVMNSCIEPGSDAEDEMPTPAALTKYVTKLEARVARLENEKELLGREISRLEGVHLCMSAQNKELKQQVGDSRIALQRRCNLLLQARLRLRDLVRDSQVSCTAEAQGKSPTGNDPLSPITKLEAQPVRKRSTGRVTGNALLPRRRTNKPGEDEIDSSSQMHRQMSEDLPVISEAAAATVRKSRRSGVTEGPRLLSPNNATRQRHLPQDCSRTRQKREASQAPAKAYDVLSDRNKRSPAVLNGKQSSQPRKSADTIVAPVDTGGGGGGRTRCLSSGLNRSSLPPSTVSSGARRRSVTEAPERSKHSSIQLPVPPPAAALDSSNLHRFSSTPTEKAVYESISNLVREPPRSGKLEKYLSKTRPSSQRKANDDSTGRASLLVEFQASALKAPFADYSVTNSLSAPVGAVSKTFATPSFDALHTPVYTSSLQFTACNLPQFSRPVTMTKPAIYGSTLVTTKKGGPAKTKFPQWPVYPILPIPPFVLQ